MKININSDMIIGKRYTINGVVVYLVGIANIDGHNELVTIHFDESFEPLNHHSHFDGSSNRSLLKREGVNELKNPIEHIHKVIIGQNEFEVRQSQTSFIELHDEHCMNILEAFKKHGWKQINIEDETLDKMAMSRYRLEGDTSFFVIQSNDVIRFTKRATSVSHYVEMPVRLQIGDDYPDKMTFISKKSGESHWVHIHRVYLMNMRVEMEKAFDNPEIKKRMTPEQIEKARMDFEENFSNVCPKGMLLPVVEYECEEEIHLQFYTSAFLDALPKRDSNGMGFFVGADQSESKYGYRLKGTIIQEPVPADTQFIDAELFQYSVMNKEIDIII